MVIICSLFFCKHTFNAAVNNGNREITHLEISSASYNILATKLATFSLKTTRLDAPTKPWNLAN